MSMKCARQYDEGRTFVAALIGPYLLRRLAHGTVHIGTGLPPRRIVTRPVEKDYMITTRGEGMEAETSAREMREWPKRAQCVEQAITFTTNEYPGSESNLAVSGEQECSCLTFRPSQLGNESESIIFVVK